MNFELNPTVQLEYSAHKLTVYTAGEIRLGAVR